MSPAQYLSGACLLLFVAAAPPVDAQQEPMGDNPLVLLRTGEDQEQALRITDSIYQAVGFSNTFMVTTPAGNVIIDTSMPFNAARHKRLLQAVNAGPVRYIILTHAHGDHTGGVGQWKQPDTQVVAQSNHREFQDYQTRLGGFFARRNAAQFALKEPGAWPDNDGATLEPTVLFDDQHEFELGGVKFELLHTPGETPDHLTVWIPQYQAAFVGDNYYDAFPNIYTLRGTEQRPALDYVDSLNKILALKPELVLPSHGQALRGNAEINRLLGRYRDAIQHVHDATVQGMNAGKDVWTLMNEIRLPAHLDVGESYGKVSWSVRGIYEGYAGWFDLNPATMYETPAAAIHLDLVRLAGGTEAVASLALERAQGGRAVEALHLSAVALTADPEHREALRARLKALETLRDRCRNSNERGWLEYFIAQANSQLEAKK